jgi:hypothetical protein
MPAPAPTIRFKRGIFTNLPALSAGEPGFTTDKSDLFIGIGGTVGDNKFFGSHRYWQREDGTTSAVLKLVNAADTGSINLKTPDGHAGVTTYTLPSSAPASAGNFLTADSNGNLSWDSVSASATFTDSTLAGVTTFSDLRGGVINAGVTTLTSLSIGSTTVLSVGANGVQLSGIGTLDVTTKNTLENILKLDPNDFDSLNVTGIGTIAGNFFANANVTLGDSSADQVTVKGTATFEQIIAGTATTAQVLETARNISVSGIVTGTASFNGGADITIATTIQNDVVGLGTHTYGEYVKEITAGAGLTGNGTGQGSTPTLAVGAGTGITVNADDVALNFSGLTTTTIADNDQFAFYDTSGTTHGKATADAVRDYVLGGVSGDITIDSSGVATIAANSVALGGDTTGNYVSDVTAGGGLTKTSTADEGQTVDLAIGAGIGITVNTDDVALKNGSNLSLNTVLKWNNTANQLENTIITDNGSTATVGGGLIVTGDLTINGTTTQVNTTELTVYDRTITLGIQTGATPSDTSWDLGILMNYGDSGVAKTAGVIWEYGDKRFKFAANSDNPGVGVNTTTPDITIAAFAPIEIGGLYINNGCTSGVKEVIGCEGGELQLKNIVVDGGSFT